MRCSKVNACYKEGLEGNCRGGDEERTACPEWICNERIRSQNKIIAELVDAINELKEKL